MSFIPGDRLTLEVGDLAFGGEGVGRKGGLVFFIPFSLPGEEVEIEITEKKRDYARGRLLKILTASPLRVKPPCPVFGVCGGCQLQHLSYGGQLLAKEKMLTSALHLVKKEQKFLSPPVIPADQVWNYRSKAQLVAGENAGGAFFGLYQGGTHRPVLIPDCLIQQPVNNRVLAAANRLGRQFKWRVYRESGEGAGEGEGEVRFLVSRSALSGCKVQVILVSAVREPAFLSDFVEALRAEVPELSGLFLNINNQPGNVVLGRETVLLWGEGGLVEQLGGLSFYLSPHSFFQVNPFQTEKLVKWVLEQAALRGGERVLDLYCGVGTFSLFLARYAGQVIGVEEVREAVVDAGKSAQLNNLTNLVFIAGKAERELGRLEGKIDLAVLDPPRKGCDPGLLKALAQKRVKRLLYISCNPPTFARDVLALIQSGYKLREAGALDLFPQTTHMECLGVLDWRTA